MKKIYLLGLLLTGLGATHAQTMSQRLDSLFTASGNFESINGGVLVAEDGHIIYQRSFGFSNIAQKRPNTASSTFNIGSVTKTFTATAILQLLEKGRLGLDDPFQKYFPDFPYAKIHIRHLLTHMSGLTDLETYFRVLDSLPGKYFTMSDIIPCIIHLHRPLKFEPGDDFDYCNINFELLALLVEQISGMPYEKYLQLHIFQPAGMNHTYVRGFSSATDTGLVINHMLPALYSTSIIAADSVSNLRLRQLLHNFTGLKGDGNIISSAEDLFRFDQALYNGKLLRPQSLTLAYTPARLNNDRPYKEFSDPRMGDMKTGLGWEVIIDTVLGKIVSHGGHYPGIWTAFVRNLEKRQTIIIYDNSDWSGIEFQANMALDILNNRPVQNLLSKKSVAQLYGQALFLENADVAFARLIEWKGDSAHFMLRERDLNTLGYQLMGDGYPEKAAEVFKVMVLLFPTSSNAYDSYGDSMKTLGRKDLAEIMYKKALALDPNNTESRSKLDKLINSPAK